MKKLIITIAIATLMLTGTSYANSSNPADFVCNMTKNTAIMAVGYKKMGMSRETAKVAFDDLINKVIVKHKEDMPPEGYQLANKIKDLGYNTIDDVYETDTDYIEASEDLEIFGNMVEQNCRILIKAKLSK